MRRLGQNPQGLLNRLTMSRPERSAARAERRAEAQIRQERDNVETADRRAAAVEAERRRYSNYGHGGW